MEIIKILNNSSAIVSDGHTQLFVTGKGLVFGKKVGDAVSSEEITEQYYLKKADSKQYIGNFKELSEEYYIVTQEIMSLIEKDFQIPRKDDLYVSLIDHIYFAVQRYRERVSLPNALLSEIKALYPIEFKVGLKSVRTINLKFRTVLTEDEAGFIAMHVANTTKSASKNRNIEVVNEAVKEMASIIENYYQLNLKESVHHNRLLTHLKYLCIRLVNNKEHEDIVNTQISNIELIHEEAWLIRGPIDDYLKEKFDTRLNKSEAMYLILHINRLLDTIKNN